MKEEQLILPVFQTTNFDHIVSTEQHILTLADSWWRKPLKTIATLLTLHTTINQTAIQKRLWISSKVTDSSSPFSFLQFCSNIFHNFVEVSFTITQIQVLRRHYLLSLVILLEKKVCYSSFRGVLLSTELNIFISMVSINLFIFALYTYE